MDIKGAEEVQDNLGLHLQYSYSPQLRHSNLPIKLIESLT